MAITRTTGIALIVGITCVLESCVLTPSTSPATNPSAVATTQHSTRPAGTDATITSTYPATSGLDELLKGKSVVTYSSGKTRELFTGVAKDMPILATTDFLWGRLPGFNREKLDEEYSGYVTIICDPLHTVESLRELLTDENGRLRTLAMLALYNREEPELLPLIAAHLNDKAATFPEYQRIALPRNYKRLDEMAGDPKTVGDIAKAMLRFYGVPYPYDKAAFDVWWAGNKDRKYCLSFLNVRLRRVTQGVSPIHADREQSLMQFYNVVMRLPDVDREVAMLVFLSDEGILSRLSSYPNQNHNVRQQLVFACRRLGGQRLIAILKDEPVISDSDWAAFADDGRLNNAKRFILEHAEDVFDPSEAKVLLAMSSKPGMVMCAVAAAKLQPAMSAEILEPLLDRKSSLGEVSVALWRLTEGRKANYLFEWFYTMQPSSGARRFFVDALTYRFNRDDRALLGRIVRDDRFIQLDYDTLRSIASGLGENLMKKPLTEEEIDRAWHPLGTSRVCEDIEGASRQYPKETAEFLAAMKLWRKRVRESAPVWAPAPTPATASQPAGVNFELKP